MKNLQYLLLSAAVWLCVSCGTQTSHDGMETTADRKTGASPAETDMQPQETDEDQPICAVPEQLRYDGQEFRVLYRDGALSYNVTDLFAEGIVGEVVNDAVYDRNRALEERFGITLVGLPNADPAGYARMEVQGGDTSFDAVLDSMVFLFPLSMEQYLLDWALLPYVDAASPWWDSNAAEELSIAGTCCLMVGDISMNASSRARFLYFNKKIAEDHDLTPPYADVMAGTWTFEKFLGMVTAVSEDLNGDGVMNGYDRFGMLTEGASYFLSGCGVLFTEKDADDVPYVACINERTVHVLEQMQTLLSDTAHTISYDHAAAGQNTSGYAHIFDWGRSLFAADHFLFVQNGANVAGQFADMTSEYGILPNPKLDTEQPSYYHLMDKQACAWAVPVTVRAEDHEKIGAVLDVWAYLSADTLVDAFYETTMKYKRFNAPEDAAMLDIVRGSIRYEISTMADVGIAECLDAALKSGNLMSSYAKKEKSIARNLKKLADAYPSNGT